MLLQGAANNGNGGNATGTELRALGLTAAEVHPQTCATCHDPHAEGSIAGVVPNNATVRVTGDIAMTAGGFAATGMGRGAVAWPAIIRATASTTTPCWRRIQSLRLPSVPA